MNFAAALIYWLIVLLWLTVFGTVLAFYIRNPRVFGTTRFLLAVVAIDTARNIVENIYFGLYFGAKYGIFPGAIVDVLGNPFLLILPKVANLAAGCVVLGLLLLRWLPSAVREHGESKQNTDDLTTLAAIDMLTGLYNRRQFELIANAEWARFLRYSRPLSVLIIDVDHFKAVNDRFGHSAGDQVLKCIATACDAVRRKSDTAARIGGEEFALLLPETTEAAAHVVAERLCKEVRDYSPVIGGKRISLTISIGIANAALGMSGIANLMKCADDALYEAKRSGRDRVATFVPVGKALAGAAPAAFVSTPI